MAIKLAYRYFGGEGKPPLVLLHGMLGWSRNWQTAGQELTSDYEVFAVDLRNHGSSPHTDSMTFAEMGEDLRRWMDEQDLGQVILLGHSLGGRVAMRFACRHYLRVKALVVVDVAPRDYAPRHAEEFAALNMLDLSRLKSRAHAERAMASSVTNVATRRFLLTNLVRDPDGGYHWKVKLSVLSDNQWSLARNPLDSRDRFDGPTLFVRGARSNYIRDGDCDVIGRYFPNFVVSTISDANHNVHHDNRKAFIACLRYFREQHIGRRGHDGAYRR